MTNINLISFRTYRHDDIDHFFMTTFLRTHNYTAYPPPLQDDSGSNDIYDHFYRHLTDSSSHLSTLEITNIVLVLVLVSLMTYCAWQCLCCCYQLLISCCYSRRINDTQPVTQTVRWSDVPSGAQAA